MERRACVLGASRCRWCAPARGARHARGIAVLFNTTPDATVQLEGPAAVGPVEGRDFELHFRWAEGRRERIAQRVRSGSRFCSVCSLPPTR